MKLTTLFCLNLIATHAAMADTPALSLSAIASGATAPSISAAALGGQEGNGGGGVLRNGVYMTFYSAGLYVEPTDGGGSSAASIPGLNALIDTISNFPVLGNSSKAQILKAIIPTAHRSYYVATPNDLSDDVRNRLLAEFARVTGIDVSHLKLFALTDTHAKTTFILPEFFKLSMPDQQAILFHEAYWIMNPDTSYNNVVKAEMSFEAALTAPKDSARTFDFVSRFGNKSEVFAAEVKWDLASGSLKGLLHQDASGPFIWVKDLVGSKAFSCGLNANANLDGDTYTAVLSAPNECQPYLEVSANALATKYPKSIVLRGWQAKLEDSGSGAYPLVVKSGYECVRYKWQEPSGTYSYPCADDHLLKPKYFADCRVYLSSGLNVSCPEASYADPNPGSSITDILLGGRYQWAWY